MSQPRIAAVLIVKNEGENLRACLQSVAGWVDEIVILDSGSSDNTAEIAAEFKANYQVEPPLAGIRPAAATGSGTSDGPVVFLAGCR